LVGLITGHEDQGMIAVVGAEPGLIVVPTDEFQTHDTARKVHRAIEIWRAKPDIAELLD
jgi:hypothetical protein